MSESFPEKYREDLAIVRETAEQVLKDFGIFGFDILFSGNPLTAYDELKQQITPILYESYQHNRQVFQSLLYRIDISEARLRKLISSGGDSASALADMILQREFQKVLTRKFFRRDKP